MLKLLHRLLPLQILAAVAMEGKQLCFLPDCNPSLVVRTCSLPFWPFLMCEFEGQCHHAGMHCGAAPLNVVGYNSW